MDATDHSPTQMSQAETPVIEPQRVAARFVDIDKWVQEQNAAEQAEAAAAAASAEAKGSKKVTPASSQVDEDKDMNSPVTNSPAPTSVAAPATSSSPAISGAAASEILGDINWVGKLHEYRAIKPSPVPLSFVESTHSFGFTCTVVLPESSNHFGGTERRFVRKKDAKQNAAKDAVTWLAANGHINANYSLRKSGAPTETSSISGLSSAPGSAPVSSAPMNSGTPVSVGDSTPYAPQIPPLCIALGFSPPTYVINTVPGTTAIYSGYAHFPGDPRIIGHIGDFTNVYGRKNAKEVCAKQVLSFLKDIERQRSEQFHEAVTGKRKRDENDAPGSVDGIDTRSVKTMVQENSQEQ